MIYKTRVLFTKQRMKTCIVLLTQYLTFLTLILCVLKPRLIIFQIVNASLTLKFFLNILERYGWHILRWTTWPMCRLFYIPTYGRLGLYIFKHLFGNINCKYNCAYILYKWFISNKILPVERARERKKGGGVNKCLILEAWTRVDQYFQYFDCLQEQIISDNIAPG